MGKDIFPEFTRSNMFLMDPELPKEDPNDMLNRIGGMTDPNKINHNCPACNRTMSWQLFTAHAEACWRKWRKVKLNTKHRVFKGATPSQSTT